MSSSDNILNLITKKLDGQASGAELEQLQQWLLADPLHQREYDDMLTIWEKSPGALRHPSFSAHHAWARINEQIQQKSEAQQPTARVARLTAPVKWTAVAAVLLGIIAAGWYLLDNHLSWQVITAATNQSVQLPDGSTVLLRQGSTLKYPYSFDASERRVQLTGEAFFQVTHNAQQPFLITTEHAAIKVLGTSFLVNAQPVKDEVVVVSGKVSVTDKTREANQVVLVAGKRTVLKNNQFAQDIVTDSNYLSWNTGLLRFSNAPLAKVLEDITHQFGITVEIAPAIASTTDTIQVNVTFDHQSLDQVLDELQLITGLVAKKEADKVVFYQK
jgi:ferric-dicitrate binding protein FerR (iron transport regulator)